jgi:hypothetical protein
VTQVSVLYFAMFSGQPSIRFMFISFVITESFRQILQSCAFVTTVDYDWKFFNWKKKAIKWRTSLEGQNILRRFLDSKINIRPSLKSRCPFFTQSCFLSFWLKQYLHLQESYQHITCVAHVTVCQTEREIRTIRKTSHDQYDHFLRSALHLKHQN